MCKDVSMKDDVFAVIADPTRRHILQALAVERLAVGELVEELGVSQPTVSKHLKVLRTAGLVETEAVGQKRFYSITPAPLTTVTDWAHSLLSAPAIETPPVEEPIESRPAAITPTENLPATPELDEQVEPSAPVVDVPHPNTAGITFTPLTPFTPVLDNRVVDVADEINRDDVSKQVRQLAQNLNVEDSNDEPVTVDVLVPDQSTVHETTLSSEAGGDSSGSEAPEPLKAEQDTPGTELTDYEDSRAAVRQMMADAEARARISDEQAHRFAGNDAGDDRGLLSKLARWGRRGGRS